MAVSAIRIEDFQTEKRKAILKPSGIGRLAFGEGSPAAKNLPVKISRNRQLTAEESIAIQNTLSDLGLHLERPDRITLLTTTDIRRVMEALNIAGLATAAFGKDTTAAMTFRLKITKNRSLSVDESEAVVKALADAEIWIEHR